MEPHQQYVKTQNNVNTAVSDFISKIFGAFYASKIWRISSPMVNRLYTRLLALLLRHINTGYLRHKWMLSFTLFKQNYCDIPSHFFSCQREIVTNKDLRGPFQNPPYCTLPCRSLDEFLVSHRYCVKYWLLRFRYRGQRNGKWCRLHRYRYRGIKYCIGTSLPLLKHKKYPGYFVAVTVNNSVALVMLL